MKVTWLAPMIAFVLCLTAGFMARQYNQPQSGPSLAIPARVRLTLVSDKSHSRPHRLEQPGVFLMSANAARRGMESIRRRLVTELQNGSSVSCDDRAACNWLGIASDIAGPPNAIVVVETADAWSGEAGSSSSDSTSERSLDVQLPILIPTPDRLIAGTIAINHQPVSLTSTSTRHDHLLASDDIEAVILGPITKKRSQVHVIESIEKRTASQVFVDLTASDNWASLQTVLKYGSLIGIALAMFGNLIPARIVIAGVTSVIFTAAVSILMNAIQPMIGIIGLIFAASIVLTLFLMAKLHVLGQVSIILFTCLLADVISGGYLGTFAGLGANPVVGARYYGLGNELSALLIGALACLFPKKLIWVIAFVITVSLLVGHPGLGANGGDMLALLIAVSAFLLIRYGKQAAKWVVPLTFLVASVIVWDAFLAPESMQSHLGRLVGSKGIGFVEIITSKFAAHLRLMATSAWGCSALLSLLWWSLRLINAGWKPDQVSLIALCLFLCNDSGPVSLTLFTLVSMLHNGGLRPIDDLVLHVRRRIRLNIAAHNG